MMLNEACRQGDFAQGRCGLTKTMTYGELSAWLTNQGYSTTVDDVKNAKRFKFVE